MRYDAHLTTNAWESYELIDSGDHMKLERFGSVTLARPETQAVWAKKKGELWKSADATFTSREGGKGAWEAKKTVPESWPLSWGDVRFTAKLTSFKHTGVFPEQSPNWAWSKEQIEKLDAPNVLNLFGYTGIASLVAAQAGAMVTHVDASKQTLDWAHDNAHLSNIPEDKIRWIPDDALAFVKREVRRGTTYEGIILDPPAFGRGAKGEVWHIEENLLPLLHGLKELLSEKSGSFFLLNGYASGYASRSFAQAVESIFGDTSGESGELHLAEKESDRVVPAGIYVRFIR
jgi:23S rRNA (cytosine1962-C5)-methyltransferase